jgi:hypothetical protein
VLLEQAIRANRERKIKALLQAAREATRQGDRYRAQAEDVAAHPAAYADPQDEVKFLMACAEPFNRMANDARAEAEALRAAMPPA